MTEKPKSKRPPAPVAMSSDELEDASPQELVREIAHTRAEMGQTLAAIEQRLNPTELREKAVEELKVVEEKVKVAVKEQIEETKASVKAELIEAKQAVKEEVREAIVEAKKAFVEAKDAAKTEAREVLSEATQALHDATIGKVKTMARQASDTVIETSETMMDTVRRNPLPAAMVGFGLAWLFMNRSGTRRAPRVQYRELRTEERGFYQDGRSFDRGQGYGPDRGQMYGRGQDGRGYDSRGYDSREQGGIGETLTHARDSAGRLIDRAQSAVNAAAHDVRDAAGNLVHQVADTAGGAVDTVKTTAGSAIDSVKNTAGSAIDTVKNTAGSAVDTVKTTATDLAHRASDQATHLADMAGERYHQVAEKGREGYHYAEERFDNTLEENPLALGAVALAIGAAIGLALPRTQRENQLFGQYREQLFDTARGYAHDAMQQAHTLGERAGEEVKGQLGAMRPSLDHGPAPRPSRGAPCG